MRSVQRVLVVVISLLAVIAAACGGQTQLETPAQTTRLVVPSKTLAPTAALTAKPQPTQTFTVQPTNTSTPTAEPAVQLCSPLAGFSLDQLGETVSNPYHPPAAGSDDPHQGVDLAERLPGSLAAVKGMGVRSALAGLVAGVIVDRFPYGNAVLVETTLADLPDPWISALQVPTPPSGLFIHPSLTCPSIPDPFPQTGRRSLYHLYAHMETVEEIHVGEALACGDPLGTVGDSGNALHPHLHFEVRVGPSGARFESLAHYDNRASEGEMGMYCLWRVSGIFSLVDPLRFLGQSP